MARNPFAQGSAQNRGTSSLFIRGPCPGDGVGEVRLPRSYGVPLAHWSRAELARHAATVSTLPTIEARTIGRWLTAEQVRPWQFHSWQHIRDPETFLQRARPVLHLYEQATALRHRKASGSSVPMKKRGSCAREAEQAPRPALPKHPVYQSPRSSRRGALQLMAALSVADGRGLGQCHARKRFVDFRCFARDRHHRRSTTSPGTNGGVDPG